MERRRSLATLSGVVLLVALVTAAGAADKHPFGDNVTVTFTDTHMIVESDGIPTHETGLFPNRDNPNSILRQRYRFSIPLQPRIADQPTKTGMGPIGVAINGVPFYNQYNAEGGDAVLLEKFDACKGHPDQRGHYHYHQYSPCLAKDQAGAHSSIIGYAFDGFAIYGPNGEDGRPPADLDECNGHTDKARGYHYHVTEKFPYVLGCYKGVVEERNIRSGRPPGPPPGRPPFGRPPGPP